MAIKEGKRDRFIDVVHYSEDGNTCFISAETPHDCLELKPDGFRPVQSSFDELNRMHTLICKKGKIK